MVGTFLFEIKLIKYDQRQILLFSGLEPEVCMGWILDFLEPDFGCFQQGQDWGYLCCRRIRVGYGFCFHWKNVTGSVIDLYFPGFKQESDCLNLVGTGSGLDSDSQFAKPDWIRTQKNQSPNTSNSNWSWDRKSRG